MGTTLTGTTPQDTYDSLIKVTDNGPLSGTAKYLSDGLGNDSALALSTSRVGIGATSISQKLEVSNGAAQFNGGGVDGALAEAILFGETTYSTVQKNRIRSSISAGANGNLLVLEAGNGTIGSYNNNQLVLRGDGSVGIGTSAPVARLDAVAAEAGTYTTSTQQVVARIFNSPSSLGSGVNSAFLSFQTTPDGSASNPVARIGVVAESYGSNNASFVIATREAAGIIEKIRVTADGYLRLATGGIQFNGDTAAANALDDYEEGTFTATITPATSGTITSGATFTTWTYTKIGRQVTINGVFVISSVASPVGANVVIGGLPFTIFNNNGAYGAFSVAYFTSATSANSAVAGRHAINTTQLTLGVNASTVAASDEIYVTATYFV